MIQSMTGYGKSVFQLPNKKITVEIKSLNSKNLDLNVRVPSTYREKELDLRKKIAASLTRGKVDFNLYVELTGEATSTQVNESVVLQYMKQLARINDGDPIELMKMAIKMPDALTTERDEIDESEFNSILSAVEEALDSINTYRTDEGKSLENDFLMRGENIASLLDRVMELDQERIANVKERLRRAIGELKETVDENRFAQDLLSSFAPPLSLRGILTRLMEHHRRASTS